MRITAENLPDSNRLLVRLLGNPIQLGTYLIDGTPQLPGVQEVDVSPNSIINDEVDLYFAGYCPLPKTIRVTLPDTTTMSADIQQLTKKQPDILGQQFSEAITPDEPLPFMEGESGAIRAVDVEVRPQVPKFWFNLNFEQSSPLSVGAGLLGYTVVYTGGGQGRALDSTHRQPAADAAPWLSGGPLRLEGSFSNTLVESNFMPTRQVSALFDPVPVGWDVVPTTADSLIRVGADSGGIEMPTMTLAYAPGNTQTNGPNVTILTPTVASGAWFQIIVAPALGNDSGTIQLTSYDGILSSVVLALDSPKVLRLNVGSHPGRVKIKWFQQSEGRSQTIQLIGPMCSGYADAHSWIPYGVVSGSDFVTTSVSNAGKWTLLQGSIRVDSLVEDRAKPISWAVKSSLGQTILSVSSGVLSSDFGSTPVAIAPYLDAITSKAGIYTVGWSTTGTTINGVSVPFSLATIPNTVLSAPIVVNLSPYGSGGTGILKLFKFSPTNS